MPSWLRRLVEAVSPSDRRDEIVGDLEEMHRRRLQRRSPGLAHLATLWDTAATLTHLGLRGASRALTRGAFTASEIRLALRFLRRTPIVSLTVVLALTCGVALAAAGFTVVRAVFDVRLPFPGGERVVEIRLRDARSGEPVDPPPTLLTADEGVPALERWGGAAVRTGNLRLGLEVALIDVLVLTPGGFDYALPPPLLGDGLPGAPPAPGEVPAAMVSESLWRSRLGGDPGVVGRTVEVSGTSYRIAGVLPAETGFPARADLWTLYRSGVHGTSEFDLYGMMAHGVGMEQVTSRLAPLVTAAAVESGLPETEVRLRRVEAPPADGSQGVLVVGFLVAFLMVIAGNVGNLMVARAAARTEELSIRAALGAHRSRLVAQLALEAGLLVAVSSAAGLAIAGRLLAWFRVSDGDQLPPWIDLSLDPRTVLFVIAVSALLAMVSGVLPALRATRGAAPRLRSSGGGGAGATFGWAPSAMIVVQIAFATGILGGAVLVHRAWSSAFDMEDLPGAGAIATAFVTLPPPESPNPEEPDGGLLDDLVGAIRSAHPESRVALSTYLPGVDAPLRTIEIEGRDAPLRVPLARVSPSFFEVVGAQPSMGALPRAGEGLASALPVAVVDRSFVDRRLGSTNAVGRRIRLLNPDGGSGAWYRIVAVVPDLGLSGMDASSAGGVYLPFTGGSQARVLVRTVGDPLALGRSLPRIAYGVDPGIAVSRIHTLASVVQGVRRIFQGLGAVFTGLGALVLGLALMGVYAILSFEVSRRRREIGIRVALGASGRAVLRPLLARVGSYVVLGGLLGWLLGTGVVSTARAMVQLRLSDGGAGVFAVLSGFVLITAATAALTPALRILGIQPAEALQAD